MANGFNNRPPLAQRIGDKVLGEFSGILSTRPIAKYTSGARCTLKINGKLVGFAFNISWRINTSYTDILTIDDVMPAELTPQRITVDGTISALHIPGTSATTEYWQPTALSFLFGKYISIEVRDSQTDWLLFYTAKAVITSRQEDLKIDQLGNVVLTWKAIGWKDEEDPANLPEGYNLLYEGADKKTESSKTPPPKPPTTNPKPVEKTPISKDFNFDKGGTRGLSLM